MFGLLKKKQKEKILTHVEQEVFDLLPKQTTAKEKSEDEKIATLHYLQSQLEEKYEKEEIQKAIESLHDKCKVVICSEPGRKYYQQSIDN